MSHEGLDDAGIDMYQIYLPDISYYYSERLEFKWTLLSII